MTVAGALAIALASEPEPELVSPLDPESAPLVPADVESESLVPELGLADVVLVPDVTALLRERAGSCPEASWMKITDQAATNTQATIATVRRRISDARRLRARSRSATTRLASAALARAGPSGGRESGVEALGGVMLCLSRADDIWSLNTVAPACRSRVRGT